MKRKYTSINIVKRYLKTLAVFHGNLTQSFHLFRKWLPSTCAVPNTVQMCKVLARKMRNKSGMPQLSRSLQSRSGHEDSDDNKDKGYDNKDTY